MNFMNKSILPFACWDTLPSLIARNFDVIMSTSEVGLDNRFAGSVDADRPSSSLGRLSHLRHRKLPRVALTKHGAAGMSTYGYSRPLTESEGIGHKTAAPHRIKISRP